MTPILDGSDEPDDFTLDGPVYNDIKVSEVETYPTEWFPVTNLANIEYRRLSEITYELRSQTHTIKISDEGFLLYKDDSLQGLVIFEDWCKRHGIVPEVRKDI